MGGRASVAAASVVLFAHVDLLARVTIRGETCSWSAGARAVVVAVHVRALVLQYALALLLLCQVASKIKIVVLT